MCDAWHSLVQELLDLRMTISDDDINRQASILQHVEASAETFLLTISLCEKTLHLSRNI